MHHLGVACFDVAVIYHIELPSEYKQNDSAFSCQEIPYMIF
jgi:hypothetical protein